MYIGVMKGVEQDFREKGRGKRDMRRSGDGLVEHHQYRNLYEIMKFVEKNGRLKWNKLV